MKGESVIINQHNEDAKEQERSLEKRANPAFRHTQGLCMFQFKLLTVISVQQLLVLVISFYQFKCYRRCVFLASL